MYTCCTVLVDKEKVMKAVFMVGGPAAGKSTVRQDLYPTLTVIDSDQIKEQNPTYDPKQPQLLHEASSKEATRLAFQMISEGKDFVFDGTGSSAEKYVRLINACHEVGYETVAVYVTCDLQTALARNAARPRQVPEAVVREKHAMVATSVDIISRYVGELKIVRN